MVGQMDGWKVQWQCLRFVLFISYSQTHKRPTLDTQMQMLKQKQKPRCRKDVQVASI